jgi:TRAP-type mannitol/chloroaromatic compound transport system substrate-binding protein
MDRRSLIKNAGIAGVLAAGAAPAIIHAQATLRWRCASSFPKSLDTLFGVCDVFAKKVSELSGGKFTITTHAAGELMPAFGVLDGVSNGTVEMANTAPYYFFGKDPTYAMDCAIPFGLNARQMNAWMYEGNGWYRKEIKSLADMKGLKFRVGGFGGKVLEPLGVVPQNIPGGEIYQALEKGTIDAAEWVGPYDDQKLGLNKVAPNYYFPGFWEVGPQLALYVNQKAYDGLSSEYKAIIECASSYAGTDMIAKYDYKNPAALKTLIGQGAKLRAFPRDVMEAAFKSSQEVYSNLSNTNPEWKKIYADYSNYRREANQWFSLAEASMNNFMERQKL